jgi:hypothetical protein
MPEIKIKTDFKTGTFVYLKTDPVQYKRMIISITYNIGGSVTYGVTLGDLEATLHYAEELSLEEDVILRQRSENEEGGDGE